MPNFRTLTALMLLATGQAHAQAPPADKSRHSIVNPTPRELWRPLSADRPDTTESPYTVDAGAIQVEMSFVDYAINGNTNTLAIAPANFKVGLLNDVDLQLVVEPYVRQDDDDETREGLGSTELRVKINLWGNDSGPNAFAFMPFIALPTASDDLASDHVEGGLIFPFATDLAEGLGLGLMLQADFVHDEGDDAYDTEFITTAVVGFDITDRLGAFVEGIGITSTDPDTDVQAILSTGMTYGVSENLVLDAGASVGLTGDADDVSVFTGMTLRF